MAHYCLPGKKINLFSYHLNLLIQICIHYSFTHIPNSLSGKLPGIIEYIVSNKDIKEIQREEYLCQFEVCL